MIAYKVHRATGAVAIDSTLAPGRQIELVCVKLHLSAAGGAAEDFTVTIDSASAAVYDVVLFSQDMTSVADIVWVPDRPIPVLSDEIDFAYANSNTRTYGLEVNYRTI